MAYTEASRPIVTWEEWNFSAKAGRSGRIRLNPNKSRKMMKKMAMRYLFFDDRPQTFR
jgi:hypothetical protein